VYTAKAFDSIHAAVETSKEIMIYPTPILHKFASNIRKFAFLQLRLPEDGICVKEAMLDPAFLLNVVQVDITTRVSVPVWLPKCSYVPTLMLLPH
jgi:hypothetical protein